MSVFKRDLDRDVSLELEEHPLPFLSCVTLVESLVNDSFRVISSFPSSPKSRADDYLTRPA